MSTHRPRTFGSTYFVTVHLAEAGSDLLVRRIEALREAYGQTMRERPFRTEAITVLPDCLHAIWTLPPDDADVATRWRLIKARFGGAVDERPPRARSCVQRVEEGLWQRRVWAHRVRDASDLAAHLRLIRDAAVERGLAKRPEDWPFASFSRDRRAAPPVPVS